MSSFLRQIYLAWSRLAIFGYVLFSLLTCEGFVDRFLVDTSPAFWSAICRCRSCVSGSTGWSALIVVDRSWKSRIQFVAEDQDDDASKIFVVEVNLLFNS